MIYVFQTISLQHGYFIPKNYDYKTYNSYFCSNISTISTFLHLALMKNYFQFTLTGKKLLPIWIAFLLLYVVPQILIQTKIQGIKPVNDDPEQAVKQFYDLMIYNAIIIPLTLIQFTPIFFLVRLILSNISYKGEQLQFLGSFRSYIIIVFNNFLLTLLTFGIYSPWFTTKMHRYFAKSTNFQSESFRFNSKGSDLFLIPVFCFLIPLCIYVFFLIIYFGTAFIINNTSELPIKHLILFATLIVMVMIIPFVYFSIKWHVNYQYKGYNIFWETSLWKSIPYLALQFTITLFTLGLYFPIAFLLSYRYFMDKTVAKSPDLVKHFGFDAEYGKDFLYIWGQTLLTIITAGIYFPWAITKTGTRILNKTYLETAA